MSGDAVINAASLLYYYIGGAVPLWRYEMFTHDTNSNKKKLSHIAFIMDGNGRWAKAKGLPREMGHREGAKVFRRITEYCFSGGIDAVTVYAFSTENWKRPKGEVSAIMSLLKNYLQQYRKEFMENDIRVRFLGEKTPFTPELRELMEEIEKDSANNRFRLNIAMNYGGRAEIVAAVNRLAAKGVTEFSEELIESELYTSGQEDPDLIVRTAGELRLSNFLTWQSVYSEFYFTDTLWPDFSEESVDAAVDAYYCRTRRFGAL